MNERIISSDMIKQFGVQLRNDEKSEATVIKYIHDIKCFTKAIGRQSINKELVLSYKSQLASSYAVTSANSMITAINVFLRFAGWTDCCIKQFKVQKNTFCSEDKELSRSEYTRLVNTAKQKNNERLSLILQTVCATGIRVSELQFITVEAVRRGEAVVCCKNKIRTVFIVRKLQKKLLKYIKNKCITTGCIFITRSGRPINRCNIWREMKALCQQAEVSPDKVFPHNLRHLFARTFYRIERDIAKLADLLGHSSINTTRIYIITTGTEHKRRMENMHLII